MSERVKAIVSETCRAFGHDRTRLVDVVRAVQAELGCVSGEAMDRIAQELGIHRVEVESTVSFYSFLSEKPKGGVVIRVCNDVVDRMQGANAVLDAFAEALGIGVGETTADGAFTLETTPCIGMSDQAPAALINDEVLTELDPHKARRIVAALKRDPDPNRLITKFGDGNNAHELVTAGVRNNLCEAGPVIFAPYEPGAALKKALAMTPQEMIREVKAARVRGRGGAGFPAGMKWEFTRAAPGEQKVILCNADEGEPGTFKDRVVLTERAGLVFEGMTISGYAVGAELGILYLRAEYAYLKAFLERLLAERRAQGLLGWNIGGKTGLFFDIRIQMGAGAYVCGEETALISSCEGGRGDPKNRPPFPAQRGYLGRPSVVNNVETFCCVARVMEHGAGWFAQLGTKGSPGTKLLSVSGDCRRPGVYELEFGLTLRDLLKRVGGERAAAVQVGGPSGQLVGPAAFDRRIDYDDLATGGAIVVFGPERDLLHVVSQYLGFFVHESCGYCTPCRVGNVLLKQRIDSVRAGRGEASDLDYLSHLAQVVKTASRCGLGQTSSNPVLSSLQNFRSEYEKRLLPASTLLRRFDFAAAVAQAEAIAGRRSEYAASEGGIES